MKFIIHHPADDPPRYELLFDDDGNLTVFSIPEDSFFDLISGCAVTYTPVTSGIPRNITDVSAICSTGNSEIADEGTYTSDGNRMTLHGSKIRGTLTLDHENHLIEIITE